MIAKDKIVFLQQILPTSTIENVENSKENLHAHIGA